MTIDFKLPVLVFRVGGTYFSTTQIQAMIDRTNNKLSVTGNKIEVESIVAVPEKSFAYVSQSLNQGYDNLVRL